MQSAKRDPQSLAPARRRLRRLCLLVSACLAVLLGLWAMGRAPREEARLAPLSPVAGDAFHDWVPVQEASLEDLRKEVVAAAEDLVKAFPDSPDAWSVLAQLRSGLGDASGAIQCCLKCVELDPSFAIAYYQAAEIAKEGGEDGQAEEYLRKLLEVDPTFADGRSALAETLIRQGKLLEAVELLPHEPLTTLEAVNRRVLLGQAYLELKEYGRAKECYEEVVAAAPKFPHGYYGLANACARLGENDAARRYRVEFARWKTAERDAHPDPGGIARDLQDSRQRATLIHMSAGRAYLKLGYSEVAEHHWRRAAELAPEGADCREMLVAFYRDAGRLKDSLAALQELQVIDPDNARYWILAGNLHTQLGEPRNAEADFQRAADLAPRSSAGYAALANLCLSSGRPAEAVAWVRRALEREARPHNYYLLATALQATGDLAGAQDAIEQALRAEPQNGKFQAAYRSIVAGQP